MTVYLIAEPTLDHIALDAYLNEIGAGTWASNASTDACTLVEIAGKVCYRSFQPGLNPNVTKVREDSSDYLRNILASGHGSVLEHANFTFIFTGVSRCLTHELVRHRAGCAYSQESLRYVRLTELPMDLPTDLPGELTDSAQAVTDAVNSFLQESNECLESATGFTEKKKITSAVRNFLPMGTKTTVCMTANARALRHIIELRTGVGADREIRELFDQVADLVTQRFPELFEDLERSDDGTWASPHRKV